MRVFKFYGVTVEGLDVVDYTLPVEEPQCFGDFFLYFGHYLYSCGDGGGDAPLLLVLGDAAYGVDDGLLHGVFMGQGIL